MSFKRRLERVENTVNPKNITISEWAIFEVEAEQKFQEILNEMRVKYGIGEPEPLLTRDEILAKARKLEQKYRTKEAHRQAFLDFERSPENQKMLADLKRKYGLI